MGTQLEMKALVIGYGSIGKRHTRLLENMDLKVAVVSRRSISYTPRYYNLIKALDDWQPGYVVVANRTSEHYESLKVLSEQNFKGRVLIEKPLFNWTQSFPKNQFSKIAVAYNFRFHPLLVQLKNLLDKSSSLVSASIYVGSYLPRWRPQVDYRESYSAHKQQGGGVLRDLSHELDYVLWLFGSWKELTARGGHFSSLEINSDDVYSLLMQTYRCPLVSIHMNYIDRIPRRKLIVNTDRHTIAVDLYANTMNVDGHLTKIMLEYNDTYCEQHRTMLSSSMKQLCTLQEAMETMVTIEAAEQASHSHTWIKR